MIERVEISCPHCGESVEVELDYSAGRRQEYIEDCWVCCRPIQCIVQLADEDEPQIQVSRAY